MQLHTYLNYGGNCEQAFRFYEQHLGGKITMMMTHGQQPNSQDVPPDWKNAILYARMSIGGTELMGSDVPPDHFQPMRSVYLSLTLGSTEEAERIYALLSEGGQIFMPMQETFFASRFGMLEGQIRHVLDDPSRTAELGLTVIALLEISVHFSATISQV